MYITSDILELESQKEKLQAQIERRKMALRLTENPDFKKLIMEFFVVDECARLAHMAGDPALDQKRRDDAMLMAQAAGHLKRFLSIQIKLGENADDDLDDLEGRLAQARVEEDHKDYRDNVVHVLDRGDNA